MSNTPGPWRVQDEFILAGGEGRSGRIIAINHDRIHYESEEANMANARLLAAAPELLEALRYMAKVYRIEHGLDGAFDEVLRQAETVIQRAEGTP